MNPTSGPQRVIIGVDGSEYSSNALRLAGRIAAGLDAPLEVITCVGMPDFYFAAHLESGNEQLTAKLQEAASRLAEEAVNRAFGDQRPADLTVGVKFGSPAKVLIDESKSAQLLVVGRHGSGGFLSQAIGSVSRACAAHSHCPVLLIDQDTKVAKPS